MDKVIETARKSALTTAGALIGGGVSTALGTALFPGAGTAVGYLFGVMEHSVVLNINQNKLLEE